MNFLKTYFFLILIVNSFGFSQDKILQSLIDDARQNNLQLHAFHHQIESERIKIDQATAWEAPQIGIEFYQTPIRSFPLPMRGGMETDYFVQQMVPWPGKLNAMSKVVENSARISEANYRVLEQQIVRDLKYAYYELYFIRQKIRINNENLKWIENLETIIQSQITIGRSKQQDLLRLHIESAKLSVETVNFQRDARTVEIMINTTLNRDIVAPVSTADSIETIIPVWSIEKLIPLANEIRPELHSMNFNLKMFQAEQSAVKKELYPDVMLKTVYKNMSNTSKDFWSFMIGINLPFAPWSKDKYNGRLLESDEHILHAEKEISSMQNMIAYDIQKALSSLENSRNMMTLYRDNIIPQYEQTLKLLVIEYQSGKLDFGMVVETERMLLMAKLDHQMATMNFMQALSDLEKAVGLSASEINQRL
ncbi:TolC family protein [bacterium]|nr:TolC family protein [bacterium]